MYNLTLYEAYHLNKVFGLVLKVNDGILTGYTYEEV